MLCSKNKRTQSTCTIIILSYRYLADSKVLGNSPGGLGAKFAEYFSILLNLASMILCLEGAILAEGTLI